MNYSKEILVDYLKYQYKFNDNIANQIVDDKKYEDIVLPIEKRLNDTVGKSLEDLQDLTDKELNKEIISEYRINRDWGLVVENAENKETLSLIYDTLFTEDRLKWAVNDFIEENGPNFIKNKFYFIEDCKDGNSSYKFYTRLEDAEKDFLKNLNLKAPNLNKENYACISEFKSALNSEELKEMNKEFANNNLAALLSSDDGKFYIDTINSSKQIMTIDYNKVPDYCLDNLKPAVEGFIELYNYKNIPNLDNLDNILFNQICRTIYNSEIGPMAIDGFEDKVEDSALSLKELVKSNDYDIKTGNINGWIKDYYKEAELVDDLLIEQFRNQEAQLYQEV